jgi:hypothetical protein
MSIRSHSNGPWKPAMPSELSPDALFECRMCGDCCRGYGGTYVSESDIQAIADFLQVDTAIVFSGIASAGSTRSSPACAGIGLSLRLFWRMSPTGASWGRPAQGFAPTSPMTSFAAPLPAESEIVGMRDRPRGKIRKRRMRDRISRCDGQVRFLGNYLSVHRVNGVNPQ